MTILATGQTLTSRWVTENGVTYDKWYVDIDGKWVDCNDTFLGEDGVYRLKPKENEGKTISGSDDNKG